MKLLGVVFDGVRKSRVRGRGLVLNFDCIEIEIFNILRKKRALSISESLGYTVAFLQNGVVPAECHFRETKSWVLFIN